MHSMNKGSATITASSGPMRSMPMRPPRGLPSTPESTSTRDVDLLWDVQKRMRLVRELQPAGLSMVELLQRVDATFERDEENLEAAMNADGFAVEFLRRQDPGSESYPISDKE